MGSNPLSCVNFYIQKLMPKAIPELIKSTPIANKLNVIFLVILLR